MHQHLSRRLVCGSLVVLALVCALLIVPAVMTHYGNSRPVAVLSHFGKEGGKAVAILSHFGKDGGKGGKAVAVMSHFGKSVGPDTLSHF